MPVTQLTLSGSGLLIDMKILPQKISHKTKQNPPKLQLLKLGDRYMTVC